MTITSGSHSLNWQDIKKWLHNALVFSAVPLIAFLTAIKNGVPVRIAAIALGIAIGNALIDLTIKWLQSSTYTV